MNNQHNYIDTLIKNKVTLIIPLYNKVNHIQNTLQSVKDIIKYDNFECIIIDDESTDGSSEIAWNFCKLHDNFKYIKIQHQGSRNPANARNVGIQLTNSEYICFLDADDLISSDYITRGVNHFNTYNIDLYIENIEVIREDTPIPCLWFDINDKPTNIITAKDILLNNVYPNFCGCLYKTEITKKYLFIDKQSEDMLFISNYMFHSQNVYSDLNNVAVCYNTLNSEQNKINEDPDIYFWISRIVNYLNELNDNKYYYKVEYYTDENNNNCWQLVENNI